MARRQPKPTTPPREKAFLVGVDLRSEPSILGLEDSLAELALLAETAGLEINGELTQKLDHPNPETFVGSGKVEELRLLVEETQSDIVLFDNELSPRHLRELEEKLGPAVRVLDRTALILDIFAQHAVTREGILQVELAQYEYRLPRLTRAWTHLARQTGGGGGRTGAGGGVGLRGPGETQLEVDRREIGRRISTLKSELTKVRAHRQRSRMNRQKTQIPIIALVGYTNAGKSTLLNRLTRSEVLVANQLFATLDPTTRRLELPGGYNALVTDTVGFIQKLPTQLVAAFRATLEEIAEADLLLHVIDITHPSALNQAQAVTETLREINADHIPVLSVLNKIDRFPDPQAANELAASLGGPVAAISARTGQGLDFLLSMIAHELFERFAPVEIFLPYQEANLISLFHEQGRVQRAEHMRGGIHLSGSVPLRLLAKFTQYQNSHPMPPEEPVPDDSQD